MRPLAFLRRTVDRIALRDRSYAWLFSPDTSDEVVSVDCETTGFDPWHDDIVSIAAVKIRGGRRILASEAFVALVKPEARITADSIKVHQIRRQDAEAGRPIREVLPEFLRFVGSRPLVERPVHEIGPDEPGAPGDQEPHRPTLSSAVPVPADAVLPAALTSGYRGTTAR